MDTTAAVETLKNLAYRPGWRFDAIAPFGKEGPLAAMARDIYGRAPRTTVLFRWESDTVDTDREYAMTGYNHPKNLSDVVPLDAADFEDADDLLFTVFNMIMRLELHEAREFFRCKDRAWNAPFHPHKPEGESLWEKCVNGTEMATTVLFEDESPKTN